MDLNSVADYFIVELWCGNVDPDNVRVAKAADGKWFYVLFDLDLSLCREVKGTTDRYIMRLFEHGITVDAADHAPTYLRVSQAERSMER